MTAPSKLLCRVHTHGYVPGTKLAFKPTCPKCQELLAAGKRTGKEPPPSRRFGETRIDWERRHANIAARRKHMLALPQGGY